MKKILASIAAAALCLSLSACGGSGQGHRRVAPVWVRAGRASLAAAGRGWRGPDSQGLRSA